MPLFKIDGAELHPVSQGEFAKEKSLQKLVEDNLLRVFNSRFVASEFATGSVHGGRIDTLALSEDDNPVIIEYKKVVSSELVNQSLYYLAWLDDHRGDFELAARKKIGPKINIDWSAIRVICLAPSYRNFDIYAVQVMGRAIELWTYRRFDNDTLYFEMVEQGEGEGELEANRKNPVMVAAGKKAALTRKTASYTVGQLLEGKPEKMRELFGAVQEFVLSLDSSIEESAKKHYIAYRTTQNIVCVEVQKQKVDLFLKLDPKRTPGPPGISRDVSGLGHFGTGHLEISLRNSADLEVAKPFIRLAYKTVGG